MSKRTFRRALGPDDAPEAQLAAAIVEQVDALNDSSAELAPEGIRPLLHKLGAATLAFVLGIDRNLQRLSALDRKFDFQLIGALLNLPARLSEAGETELAVRVAEALKFCAPDDMNGEIALAYARAGDRQRALSQVLTNLETATEPFVAESKAGDVYRQLAEEDAAEAYYRRALAIAKTESERREATLRIASLMLDTDREADAAAFVAQQGAAASAPSQGARAQRASVGRNDPCPCGSGKKYKKCHGA